jgi:hypothetical protein
VGIDEPHVVVLRGVRPCAECGSTDYFVVAVPKVATGQLYPVVGQCEACGVQDELWGSEPLGEADVRPCFVCRGPVVCEAGYPADVSVVCEPCRRGSLN